MSAVGINSDSRCVNDFSVLKNLSPDSFSEYRTQFDVLNSEYKIFSANSNKLDKDQKQLFSMALDSKLIVICARVKYASFSNVNKEVRRIYDL